MNIVIINGQNHTRTTCHIARELAEKIGGRRNGVFPPPGFS